MGSIVREITTSCPAASVWEAIRDVGALHTRLVPGFVVNTELQPGARIVTFANGMVVREPIVHIDERQRRLVWTAENPMLSHYNASVQVFELSDSPTRVVWTADFLPDAAAEQLGALIDQGMQAMKIALDGS
jgi:hypothetical protein